MVIVSDRRIPSCNTMFQYYIHLIHTGMEKKKMNVKTKHKETKQKIPVQIAMLKVEIILVNKTRMTEV